jgi:hypothetical protein
LIDDELSMSYRRTNGLDYSIESQTV